MQLHDCNAFLVGMSACFLGRHSSSTKSQRRRALRRIRAGEGVPYIRFGRKPPAILEDFFPETKTVATLAMQWRGYTIPQINCSIVLWRENAERPPRGRYGQRSPPALKGPTNPPFLMQHFDNHPGLRSSLARQFHLEGSRCAQRLGNQSGPNCCGARKTKADEGLRGPNS